MYMSESDSTMLAEVRFIPGPHKGQQVPRWPAHWHYVYQYHLDPPYRHAKHYTGFTSALAYRLHCHEHGHGARLTQVAVQHGCRLILCRLWRCESAEQARRLERKLKRDHGPKFCPLCNPRQGPDPAVLLYQGHWPFSTFSRPGRRQPTGERTWKLR